MEIAGHVEMGGWWHSPKSAPASVHAEMPLEQR
jgi:hypothetical protein